MSSLGHPPEGITQFRSVHADMATGSSVQYVEWAPGNGLVLRLYLGMISDAVSQRIGGKVVATVNSWRTGGHVSMLINPHEDGLYHLSYITEKLPGESPDFHRCVTALLNWLYYPDTPASKYADEVFAEVNFN